MTTVLIVLAVFVALFVALLATVSIHNRRRRRRLGLDDVAGSPPDRPRPLYNPTNQMKMP